jgi:hypothetical protein
MNLHSLLHLNTNRDGVVSRRAFLRHAAVAGAGVLGWKDAVALHAAELRQRGLSCILLWMGGGPSQFETFDPKPGVPTGGPTKAIPTTVPGVHIAEDWVQTAKMMKDIAVVRSMTSKEGEHDRASYYIHTGYTPSPAVQHPHIGSVVIKETAPAGFPLPNFVRINSYTRGVGPGILGMQHAAFNVPVPTKMPNNVVLPTRISTDRLGRRLELMKDLTADFAAAGAGPLVQEHKDLYDRAARLMLSKDLQVFDVNQEKDAVRDRYGRNPFGQACLLARRLVEQGVTFIEVASGHPMAPAAWDTHIDNFAVTKLLVDWVDPAYAALLTDLKERGLLEKTLVIWMGEFGRTPKINDRGKTGGRDHFPTAFNVALSGAGIQTGQVIGSTTADGSAVKDRPVTVPDLLCTFCKILGIDPRKENEAPSGFPVKIVDGGEVVKELLG